MSRLAINSNISSLNAQRNFGTATKKLSESYNRLSSGLRINKSSDDAAGLAISESLKSETRIFNQGVKNLNDGVSLLNIADGALEELSGITIRLRELATQSSNGTLGNKQRQALDQEAQSLAKEFNRIARSTEFNGLKLFDGDFGELSLAAGGGRNTLIESGLGGGIGDGTFLKSSSFAAASVYTISGADLNQDGKIDLVSADRNTDSVSVFIGNGDGTFKSKVSYASTGGPADVQVADLNGDGKLDLVSANQIDGRIAISMGNGDGTFQRSVSYNTGNDPYTVIVKDFNNDGILDLSSADRLSDSISILTGNGNGTFRARVSYVSGTGPFGLGSEDFNGDGILDIVSADRDNQRIDIYIGNINGTFNGRVSYSAGVGPLEVEISDFNNDGVLDIATAEFNSGTLSIFFGNTNGSFNARVSYASFVQTNGSELKDFNGDGNEDLVTTNSSTNSFAIFLGNADGSFKAYVSYQAAGVGLQSAFSADLNGDGAYDLINGDFSGGSISVSLANSNNGVSALQGFSLRTKQDSMSAMDYLSGELEKISRQRGTIGAFQSRVDTAINTLQTSSLNYQDATSRITDVDVAEESSKLTAGQILQQSSASVLAQANQQPRLALQLLEGI